MPELDTDHVQDNEHMPANPLAVFLVPRPLNPYFTGQADLLTALRKYLQQKRMVALWGLGGLGKTQVTVAYAHKHRNDYSAVLCLSGDTIAAWEQGLLDLAYPLKQAGLLKLGDEREREQGTTRRAVLEYLRLARNYLLIIDNVDDPLALYSLWPKTFGGHILISSRNREVQRLGAFILPVQKLPPDQARMYLSTRHPAYGREEQQALDDLVVELDGLPLALVQAAAFLSEHQSRYFEYVQQYRKQKLVFLERGLPDCYPHSIATAWEISMKQLEHVSQASLDLLHLCAQLHPLEIPEEMFAVPVHELRDSLRKAFSALAEEGSGTLALDYLLEPLLRYALVERNRANRSLSLHCLVKEFLLYRMSRDEQAHWAQAAVAQVYASFPDPDLAHWGPCRRFLPQIPLMLDNIVRFDIRTKGAAHILLIAANYLEDLGQCKTVEVLYRRALSICENEKSLDDKQLGDLLQDLGRFLSDQGNLTEAEQFLRRALTKREMALQAGDPKVVATLNDLGKLLRRKRQFEEARAAYSRALEISENALGKEHQYVAMTLHNIGILLHWQGMLEQAEPLLRKAMKIREKALGSGHPEFAQSLSCLGLLLSQQKKHAQAEPLQRKALDIRMNALGDDHPDVGLTLSNLAVTLVSQRKLTEAEQCLRRALAIFRQTLPIEHPHAIAAQASLRNLLKIKRRH